MMDDDGLEINNRDYFDGMANIIALIDFTFNFRYNTLLLFHSPTQL